MADYERVALVKSEVFVYRIPPLGSNRGYRAADWKLDAPDWTGRLRCVAVGPKLEIRLEDKTSGQLFAKCPVEKYPGPAVEAVLDSSRYFVIRLINDDGNTAFIGIGFADRGDSFDLNVALQDHFKYVEQDKKNAEEEAAEASRPKLDMAFKEGQTITISLGAKKEGAKEGASRSRARPSGGGGAAPVPLLPPPPSAKGSVLAKPPAKLPAVPSGAALHTADALLDPLAALSTQPAQASNAPVSNASNQPPTDSKPQPSLTNLL